MNEAPSSDIFSIGEVRCAAPREAAIYISRRCARCGERTAEPWLRVKDGKFLCLDCCEGADLRG